jgi:hypothetical protein
MKDKEIEHAVFEIIRDYGTVLQSSARRTFIFLESTLPHSKKVIGNAIRVALSMVDDEDMKAQLKSSYISLANFVPDKEAKELEEIPRELFSFLEMDKDKKREFLHDRFKSGLLGDYEQVIKITKRIAGEQKRLREEMDEF